MWQMVGIPAELERSLIQERTKAGRAAVVACGVKMGRKRLLPAQQVAHARKLIEQGEHPDNVWSNRSTSCGEHSTGRSPRLDLMFKKRLDKPPCLVYYLNMYRSRGFTCQE